MLHPYDIQFLGDLYRCYVNEDWMLVAVRVYEGGMTHSELVALPDIPPFVLEHLKEQIADSNGYRATQEVQKHYLE